MADWSVVVDAFKVTFDTFVRNAVARQVALAT